MFSINNEKQFGAILLKCEGHANPIGIEAEKPAFSWIFNKPGKNITQSAYRIIVSSTPNSICEDMWDSGKIESGRTYCIRYEGKPLASKTRYYWRVRVWDEENRQSELSEEAYFEMGVLEPAGWTGKWISGHDLYRNEFDVSGDISKARVYIACIGYYELRINGTKIGDQVLTPSYTDYEKRIEYHVYDITEQIKQGRNAVGVMLGHGMLENPPFCQKHASVMLQMEIFYANGSVLTINSNEMWEGSNEGPIVENSVFNGEVYDARKEQNGWDKPGFTVKWEPAFVRDEPAGKLVPQILPPIRVIRDFEPVSINKLSDNTFVADLGQNIAGWAQIKIEGKRGTEVILKYAELLHDNGTVNQLNLGIAKATDRYILKGEGLEVYEPRFTYHGFRYIQVENYPGELTKDKITGKLVCSDVEEISNFECSDDLLNKIHHAMKWTLRDNLHSVPTDCPQRSERRGWLADGHLASDACIYNFDMHNFYRKWLDDISDVQNKETGALDYSTAPRWFEEKSVPWSAAYFVITWNLYKYYNDVTILEKHYENLKSLFHFWASKTKGEERDVLAKQLGVELSEETMLTFERCNDWLAIERTPYPQVINGFYYLAAKMLEDISDILGKKDEFTYFKNKAEKIRNSYNESFYSKHSFFINNGFYSMVSDTSQFAQAFPLWLGIPDEDKKDLVESQLLWDIEQAHGSPQITTGIVGTKYIIDLLSRMKRNDLVLNLFRRTDYPSWGFMINKGATTVWERWQYMTGNEMNSHNHPALAAPDTWFFQELAGIKIDELIDDRRKFCIAPYFADGISYVDTYINTPWGKVEVSWKRENSKFNINISVPANTMSEIEFAIPGCEHLVVSEKCGLLDEDQIKYSDGKALINVGSGMYEFILSPKTV